MLKLASDSKIILVHFLQFNYVIFMRFELLKNVCENEQSGFDNSEIQVTVLVWYSSDCESPKCMCVVRGAIRRQLIKMLFARMSRTLFTTSNVRHEEMSDAEMLLLWNFSQETIIFIIFNR